MQLAFDSLDRLVELVEEQGGRLLASEAAHGLFATERLPEGMARSLLQPLVAEDGRLSWRGSFVALAEHNPPLLEHASFCVFDLETTGLSTASARICEIGAVRVECLELAASFQTLVAPGVPLPVPIGLLTGLSEAELAQAPRIGTALRRFMSFTGNAVLVAHNARFDTAFINRELERLTGKRFAGPVVDTVSLARNLLRGRGQRASLAALSHYFGTATRPCHRALPDAEATAEILLRLIGIAQERGARTVADLEELAAPKPRVIHAKRRLARDAPTRPGVYLFHDAHGQVLYVGKARDLRARLRTYFGSHRQRPALEAALGAVERIEWRLAGSELAAALEEVQLIRELRPPANARRPQPERYVYLRRGRGDGVAASKLPSAYGPLRRRAHAERAARALNGCSDEEFARLLDGGPLPRLRARLDELADCLQYEQAARLRDRIHSLERVVERLRTLDELRRLELCLVTPALEQGWLEARFVCGGRIVCRRRLPPGEGARLEIEAGLAVARATEANGSLEPERLDELIVIGSFVKHPPPELGVFGLDADDIEAGLPRLARASEVAATGTPVQTRKGSSRW